TETALAAVWCELLGLTQVGRHDNFFELGGHSLMAVKLLTQMAKAGLETTLATLFTNPILCQLASALTKPGDLTTSLLEENPVPLKISGNESPLFLLHEPSGDPLVYSALAEKLTINRPVYALQALGLHTIDSAPETLEELASGHLKAICSVQPVGPYYLAGWSLGGIIGYEIACQLVMRGEKVAYLGMIDSFNPALIKSDHSGTSSELSIRDDIIFSFIHRFVPNNQKHILEEVCRPIDIEKLFDLCLRYKWLPSNFSFDDLLLRLDTALYIRRLGLNYVPRQSEVNVDLYIASDKNDADLWRGWRPLINKGSSIHLIGGTHNSIMQMPLLKKLAKQISCELSPRKNYHPLVTLRDGMTDATPMFCIPGAGASAISFLEFANTDLYKGAIYAFQAPSLDDSDIKPYKTIEETASDYIEAMIKHCPYGPYRIVGHSFGGWVAFEMALQLQALGEPVSDLVILDSRAPGVRNEDSTLFDRTDTIIKLIKIYNLMPGCNLPVDEGMLIASDKGEQVNVLYKALIHCGIFTEKTSLSSLERILDVMQENMNTRYLPSSSYNGKMLLINAIDSDVRQREENEKNWKKYAKKIEVIHTDGNHMSMLKTPQVIKLIEILHNAYSKSVTG
ncbi:Thioesterase domain-containing protein, partial [Izhakiella capsodis]